MTQFIFILTLKVSDGLKYYNNYYNGILITIQLW